MWKKTFIRLGLVMLIALAGLLLVAAADRKIQSARECARIGIQCPETDNSQSDLMIWESLSRSIFSATRF
jgi:hypothetical protein